MCVVRVCVIFLVLHVWTWCVGCGLDKRGNSEGQQGLFRGLAMGLAMGLASLFWPCFEEGLGARAPQKKTASRRGGEGRLYIVPLLRAVVESHGPRG